MVKRQVVRLGWHQLAGPELQGVPPSVCLLLQDGANAMVAVVCAEKDWRIFNRESQCCSLLQGNLGMGEGIIALLGPEEVELGGRQVHQWLRHVCQAQDEHSVVVDEHEEMLQRGLVHGGGKVDDPGLVALDWGDAILIDVVPEELDGCLEEL